MARRGIDRDAGGDLKAKLPLTDNRWGRLQRVTKAIVYPASNCGGIAELGTRIVPRKWYACLGRRHPHRGTLVLSDHRRGGRGTGWPVRDTVTARILAVLGRSAPSVPEQCAM